MSSTKQELELYTLLGYNGSPLCCLGNGDICYSIATGILFYNYKTGIKSFFTTDATRPTTCLRYCAKTNTLVFSERRLNPTITFLSLPPEKKIIQKIEGMAKTEFVDFAFSRDGQHFVSLSGLPEYALSIFQQTNGQYQLLARYHEMKHQAAFVSFNPRNPMELCTSGSGHITFWRVDRMQNSEQLLPTEGRLDAHNVRLYSHCWTPTGEVLTGSYAGEVYKFDVGTGYGQLMSDVSSMELVVGIIPTLKHVLIATMDGTVRMCSNELTKVEKQFQVSSRAISVFHIAPEYHTLIIGGSDGTLFSVFLSGYEKPSMTDEELRICVPRIHALGDFSGKPLVGVVSLSGEICATVGEDGLLRVWDYSTNTLFSKIHVGKDPTCVEMGAAASAHLMVVGHETGTVRMFNMSKPQTPTLHFREKLSRTPIRVVRVHPLGRICVVAVEKNIVFFIDCLDSVILGFVHVGEDSPINDIAWMQSGQAPQCLVSQHNGDITLLLAPKRPSTEADCSLVPEDVIQNMWKLDYPAKCIHSMAVFGEDTLNLLALSADKDTKLYILDLKTHSDYKEPKFKELRPSAVYPDHEKVGSSLTVSDRKPMILTAGTDGRICLRDGSALTQQNPGGFRDTTAFKIRRHSPFGKGVCNACFSKTDPSIVLSAGGDGVLMVWKTPGTEKRDSCEPFSILAQEAQLAEEPEEVHDFLVKQKLQSESLEMLMHEGHRQAVRQNIAQIGESMKLLRKQNEAVPEMEQLQIHEFVAPRQLAEVRLWCDKDIEKMKDAIYWENLRKDWLIDKIKKECWDSSESKLTLARGLLNDDVEVPNYVIPKKTKREMLLFRKLKFLRKVEVVERSLRGERDPLAHIYVPAEGEEDNALDDDGRNSSSLMRADSPDPPPAPAAAAAGDEEAEKKPQKSLQEECDEPVDDLLYPEFRCYTRQRIVIQSSLLLSNVTMMKKQFNVKFTDMMKRKKNEIEKILEKNIRIRQIMKELDETGDIFVPTFAPSEKPEKLLEVTDEEIGLDKSLDPALKANAEADAEAERRRKAGIDDSSDRALQKWMDGKLEKDERSLEIKIDIPSFADENSEQYIPPEVRTEEHAKLYKEYEKRLAKKQEEIAARRKQFQLELEALKKETLDLAKAYDISLLELLSGRLAMNQAIYHVELRVVKLLHVIVVQEDRQRAVGRLAANRALNEERSKLAQRQAEAFKLELEEKLWQLKQLQEEERSKERTLKTQPCFLDAHEHAETLMKIYAKTKQQKKKGDKVGGPKKDTSKKNRFVDDALSMDPFAFAEREEEARKRDITITKIDPASQDPTGKLERPEGIPQEVWLPFLDYRQARLDAERDIRRLQDETTDMQREYQSLVNAQEEMMHKYEECVSNIAQFDELTSLGWYNSDVLHVVKQGKVEVEQKAVVTEYGDAILIHQKKIHELNRLIRKSGDGKVRILEEMKKFKKGIRLIEWQNEMLQYMVETLEMEHKHLHTLRVTKQMQEFIKGGGEGHNESERAKLLKKIEETARSMQVKIEEKKQLIVKYKKMTKQKQGENAVLAGHVEEVKVLVKDRKNIVDLQTADLDRERNERRMKLLRSTRRLEDVAKAQQEEMSMLKKEIDRLRERTFPSFAIVSKRVVGYPDEAKSQTQK